MPGPGIEPGTHWWEVSAHTTAPTLPKSRSTCDLSYDMDKLYGNSSEEKRKVTHLLGLQGPEPCYPMRALPTPNHWQNCHQATLREGRHEAGRTEWILAHGLGWGLFVPHNLPHPFWTLPLTTPTFWYQLSSWSLLAESAWAYQRSLRHQSRYWLFHCNWLRKHSGGGHCWPWYSSHSIFRTLERARCQA